MTWSLGKMNRKQALKCVGCASFVRGMSPICVTTAHAYGMMTRIHQSPPST